MKALWKTIHNQLVNCLMNIYYYKTLFVRITSHFWARDVKALSGWAKYLFANWFFILWKSTRV